MKPDKCEHCLAYVWRWEMADHIAAMHPETREGTDDDLRAAVLPLIDYEAATKEFTRIVAKEFTRIVESAEDVNPDSDARNAKAIVDAALGLKENE